MWMKDFYTTKTELKTIIKNADHLDQAAVRVTQYIQALQRKNIKVSGNPGDNPGDNDAKPLNEK